MICAGVEEPGEKVIVLDLGGNFIGRTTGKVMILYGTRRNFRTAYWNSYPDGGPVGKTKPYQLLTPENLEKE